MTQCLYHSRVGPGYFHLAPNLGQAGMMAIITYGPMIFLSGAWTPPEAMPRFIRLLMLLSPLHYYIDASYGCS